VTEAGWFAPQGAGLVALWLVVVAGLMVSRLPTFSGKMIRLKVSRLVLLPPVIVAMAAALGMAIAPWQTLALMMAGYLASLPISQWRFAVLSRRHP
jgi:CDP-diacylglycerol--serine O-phosphatidyltransferase